MILFYAVYTALFVLVCFLIRRTTVLLRRLKASKGLNMLGTLLADVVLAALMIGGLTYGVIHYGWFFGGRGETYIYERQEWDVSPIENVPLTLSDLTGERYEHIYRRRTEEGSFFLPSARVWEVVLSEDGERLHLSYDFCAPKFSWLQKALLEDRLEEEERPRGFGISLWGPEDPAPWGAEAAWHHYLDDTPLDAWVLAWPGRVAVVEVDNPTPEQKAVIGERLGPRA